MKLLKNKNLVLLILGQFVSQFGSGMQSFALSLYVLHVTGSGTMFASVLAIGALPRLVLGPVCGVFADWFDRKKIIVYLDLLSAVVIGGMFLLSLRADLTMAHIYALVIIMSVISALFVPAIGTALPSVVPKEDLVGANSMNRFVMTLCFMISPIVAGLIFGLYGITVVLFINGVSFLLSAISESFIDLETPNRKKTRPSYQDFKEDFTAGIRIILDHKLIRSIISLSIAANALIAPAISVGLIFVANQLLAVEDWQLGMLQMALVSGSLVGILFTGPLTKKYKLERILAVAVIVIGGLVGLVAINGSTRFLGLFPTNLVPYVFLVAIAVSITSVAVITNIGVATMMQREVPLEMLGRVTSVKETLSMAAVPLGQMIFGVVFDYMIAPVPFVISSILVILLGLRFMKSHSTNETPKPQPAVQ